MLGRRCCPVCNRRLDVMGVDGIVLLFTRRLRVKLDALAICVKRLGARNRCPGS
jgi:hypothetical protein